MAPTSTQTTPLPEAGRRVNEQVMQELKGKRIVIPDLFQFLPGWEVTIHGDVEYISLRVNDWVAQYGWQSPRPFISH